MFNKKSNAKIAKRIITAIIGNPYVKFVQVKILYQGLNSFSRSFNSSSKENPHSVLSYRREYFIVSGKMYLLSENSISKLLSLLSHSISSPTRLLLLKFGYDRKSSTDENRMIVPSLVVPLYATLSKFSDRNFSSLAISFSLIKVAIFNSPFF